MRITIPNFGVGYKDFKYTPKGKHHSFTLEQLKAISYSLPGMELEEDIKIIGATPWLTEKEFHKFVIFTRPYKEGDCLKDGLYVVDFVYDRIGNSRDFEDYCWEKWQIVRSTLWNVRGVSINLPLAVRTPISEAERIRREVCRKKLIEKQKPNRISDKEKRSRKQRERFKTVEGIIDKNTLEDIRKLQYR